MNLGRHFVGDRYQMMTLLATGGMGQVWRARDLALERPVAVKVLRPRHAADATALSRFRREARLTAGLTHPNIATVHDYGEARLTPGPRGDRIPFLVMELVDGEPLSAVLRREGRVTPARTLQIVRQTAAGLAAAHAAGVVHRDVKPSNLLLGPGGTVKITDFGIAWSGSRDPLTGPGEVMGTAQYLSPERAHGAMAGPASDVYALGLVAYECLAGRRPFDGASPVQVALMHAHGEPDPLPDDVPARVRELVARMLVKDPRKRIADGAAVLRAVEEAVAGSAVLPEPDPDATTVLRLGDPGPLLAANTGAPGRARHAAVSRRPSRRLVILLIPVLALVAVLAGVLAGVDRAPAPAAGSTPAPTTTLSLRIAPEDYVGRPVGEVEAELRGLGFSVRERAFQTADAPAGSVLAVDPTGEVSPGQIVVVTYAVPSHGGKQEGDAATDDTPGLAPEGVAPTRAATPTTVAAPTTAAPPDQHRPRQQPPPLPARAGQRAGPRLRTADIGGTTLLVRPCARGPSR
ncbi:protein kinase domain-containing protein [Geodermatophilus ruber]|uniref:non-specific serine/threonine protein kinase n=1 Tax=Geodermatophilus ruber TaxID=504800 RepID=A0A1I4C233_9ACTN|nr:protein kinase [Geodermatophilus ruber]SFK74853.1 serine/threonine protein kinase [Geodermatophilus ruber]